MYEWNVRVIKTQSTFAEFIVEAKTKEEAEAKINPEKDVTDDHWNQTFKQMYLYNLTIQNEWIKILPNDYDNPDEKENE